MLELDVIYNEDCLRGMARIPSQSIDMILADLPRGRTFRSKDISIPPTELWQHYCRVIKDNGCIALFCDGMYMADLMTANRKMWRYNLIWDRVLADDSLNADRQPLQQHEEVAIFYKNQPTYNPQEAPDDPNCPVKYPASILHVPKLRKGTAKHPKQKPLALMEYLIRTFTNEGDVVLDSCCGSGSTLVAARNTGRQYIGFELNRTHYTTAKMRLDDTPKAA